MTVRTTPINPDRLRAAQTAWLDSEFTARAAFALIRIDSLDRLAAELTEADRFDAAYAVWDDYIDGRRDDERFEPLTSAQLGEQASMFARLSRYLSPAELIGLALRAWGVESFEVFTRASNGTVSGKLGWYRGDSLNVVSLGEVYGMSFDTDLTIWREQGRVRQDFTGRRSGERKLGLHPVFGRADS